MKMVRQFTMRLRREPAFAAIFVITLALGVGANAALFSALRGYFLAPLPYPDSNRLITASTAGVYGPGQISMSTYEYLRRHSSSISSGGLSYGQGAIVVVGNDNAQKLRMDAVTASWFKTMGVEPFLGRTFGPDADKPGGPRQVVLSYHFWESALHGDPQIVGKTIKIDATTRTIIGVMPRGFYFPYRNASFWLPIKIRPSDLSPAKIMDMSGWTFVARLRPGVNRRTATRELNALAQRQLSLAPKDEWDYVRNRGYHIVTMPLRQTLFGSTGTRLLLIELGAFLLLLLTVAILANLVTMRSLARRHESALRFTLGAGRWSLWRTALTDTLPLGLVSGALAFGLAWWGTILISDYGIGTAGTAFSITPDLCVALFSLVLGGAVGALAALPAALGSRRNLLARLSEGARGDVSRPARLTQRGLTVVQIALGVALMINAALLGFAFNHASSHPTGVTSENLYIADLGLHGTDFARQKPQFAFYRKFGDAMRNLPGIKSAGVASELPFASGLDGYNVDGVGGIETHSLTSVIEFVDGHALQALGTPLVHGRLINASDVNAKANVAVIDTRLAQALFGKTDVVGREVKHNQSYRIVGVIRPIRWRASPNGEVGTMWLPYTVASADSNYYAGSTMDLAMRSTLPAATVRKETETLLHKLAPEQAFSFIKPMQELKSRAYHGDQALPILFGLFSLLALVLAAVGTYGTVAYLIRLRLGEFAVRQAVGATPGRIGMLALAQGIVLAALGIGIGVVAGFLLARTLAGLIAGSMSETALAYVVAALVMALATLLATAVPARRARRADLLSLLRPQ